MSGVGITGLIANLPGTVTPYPTQDPALEIGGFRQVADSTARDGILPQFRVVGMCVVTQNDGVEYELIGGTANVNWTAKTPLPAVTAADNGDNLSVVGGLWAKAANAFLSFTTTALRDAYTGLRTAGMLSYVTATQCLYLLAPDQTTWLFFAPSPALASQAAWAIDIATGSDNNSGVPGSPLASTDELSRRLCPGGQACTPKQNTTLTIAAGDYSAGRLDLNLNWPGPTGLEGEVFSIQGAFTSTANMALTAVTNTTDGTVRGQLTVGSGALTAKRRIRSTSGAQVGAICYSTGSNGGSTTNHFVSAWFSYNSEANINIANGTSVAIDTLGVTLGIVTIQNYGQGYLELRDCIQSPTKPWSFPAASEGDLNGRQTFLVGCELNGKLDGLFYAQQCRVTGATNVSCSKIAGAEFDGCCVQSSLRLNGFVNFGGFGSNCVDGGSVSFNYGIFTISKSCEFENGVSGTALAVQNMASVQVPGAVFLWGLTGAWAVGMSVDSLCRVVGIQASQFAIPGTQPMTLSGQNFLFSAIPVALPETGAAVALTVDAQAVSATCVPLYQVAAARGNQGTTTLATAPRKGAYTFWAYLAPTVVGTLGPTVQVNAIFKDDSGTTRTVPVLAAGVDITTLTGNGGEITIETDGVANVSFSVTGVTTQGALQYSLRAGIRILSQG